MVYHTGMMEATCLEIAGSFVEEYTLVFLCFANPLIGDHYLFLMTFLCLVSVPPLIHEAFMAYGRVVHPVLPLPPGHTSWSQASLTDKGQSNLWIEPYL